MRLRVSCTSWSQVVDSGFLAQVECLDGCLAVQGKKYRGIQIYEKFFVTSPASSRQYLWSPIFGHFGPGGHGTELSGKFCPIQLRHLFPIPSCLCPYSLEVFRFAAEDHDNGQLSLQQLFLGWRVSFAKVLVSCIPVAFEFGVRLLAGHSMPCSMLCCYGHAFNAMDGRLHRVLLVCCTTFPYTANGSMISLHVSALVFPHWGIG